METPQLRTIVRENKFKIVGLLVFFLFAMLAIETRVTPAIEGTMAGHLLSLDDPYYHYKQTNRLYLTGDIADRDYSIYPPDGREAPERFPYYYNAELARITGSPIRDVIILYPVFIAIFGAVIIFALMRELTNNWVSGLIGSIIFLTMPAILYKSVAGAVEEDFMGLVFGILSMYLLIKALNTRDYRIAILSGISFSLTILTWKGSVFLFALPFIALSVYHIIATLLKQDIWYESRIMIVSCIIPVAFNFLVIKPLIIDLLQWMTLGFVITVSILCEFFRIRFLKQEDTKTDIEKQIFKFIVPVLIGSILIGLVFFNSTIINIPTSAYEEFSGTSAHNYLVDKTISEQSQVSSGDLKTKLIKGYNIYGTGELLTLIALFLIPLIMVLLYYYKVRDNLLLYLRAYVFTLSFFIIAMTFVWVEARLTFSQSLGFMMLGCLLGIVCPTKIKDLFSLKMLGGLLVVATILATLTLIPFVSMADPYWFESVRWLDENTDDGDYVLTWWDYGHFITALSHNTVIADPLQAGEDYIMEIARFFQGFDSEAGAMDWLAEQPWNKDNKVEYIILDYSLIGKASALAFLGTNYYEYPNGQDAVDGTCSTGILCVNTPDKCCEKSFNWRDIVYKGGSVVLLRSARVGVYTEYKLDTSHAVCDSQFVTSPEARYIKLGDEQVKIKGSYLYVSQGSGEFSDGNTYVALMLFRTEDDQMISTALTKDCKVANLNDLISADGDDIVNLKFGAKVGNDYVPEILVLVPKEWRNTMFTQLYLYDAKNLEDIELISTEETNKFFPAIKIFKIKTT